MSTQQRHILSVLVENKPGVLSRVTGLVSRRGFNIESLSVGPTEDQTLSRLTIIMIADDVAYEQITKQLHKLINVSWCCSRFTPTRSAEVRSSRSPTCSAPTSSMWASHR